MAVLFLSYPRLSVSLSVPDGMAGDARRNFAPVLAAHAPPVVHEAYRVQMDETGLALARNGTPMRVFPDAAELMFFLEEDIENALIGRVADWVAFHAGAAALHDGAVVVVGHPDTGKTTTTFQLVELGLALLCEEVTPVDPATSEVHPFPHALTLARGYADQFLARFPVTHGVLSYHGREIARYAAGHVAHTAVPVKAVLFPSYNPSCVPGIEEVPPGQVLTDLLQYCFKPSMDDERLYDNVIRVIERCRLFRLQTSGIESSRRLLAELIAELS